MTILGNIQLRIKKTMKNIEQYKTPLLDIKREAPSLKISTNSKCLKKNYGKIKKKMLRLNVMVLTHVFHISTIDCLYNINVDWIEVKHLTGIKIIEHFCDLFTSSKLDFHIADPNII